MLELLVTLFSYWSRVLTVYFLIHNFMSATGLLSDLIMTIGPFYNNLSEI